MSDKRSEAQQNRRARERQEQNSATQAAKAADAAASRLTDQSPTEFQPDPDAASDAFNTSREERPREIRRGNPERTAAYDQMMENRRAAAQADADAIKETPRPVETAPTPGPESTATAAPETSAAVEPAPIETVRVKIDGQELDVPKSEVEDYGGIRPYQIAKANEKRLEESRRLASDMGRMFQQMQAAMQPRAPAEPVKPPQQVIQEAIQRIQLGTPEEGAQAFMQAIGQVVPKAPDEQAIIAKTMLVNTVMQAENAFIAQNQDLVGNPMLKQLVIGEKFRRLDQLQKQNRLPDDWNAFYTSIATDVRAAIGRPPSAPAAATTANQPTSGLAEKEARKASIVALPTAATRAVVPEADKPLSRDEIIARARKARGQAV